MARQRIDSLKRAEQFIEAAETEATFKASETFDSRVLKIIQLLVLPSLRAARAALQVARHIDTFPSALHVDDEQKTLDDTPDDG